MKRILPVLALFSFSCAEVSSPTIRTVTLQKTVGEHISNVEVVVSANSDDKAKSIAKSFLGPDSLTFRATYTGLVWSHDPTVYYNPTNQPTGAENSNLAGMQGWDEVPSSHFMWNFAGNTSRCPSLVKECKGPQSWDGNNDVTFLKIKEPGVLGVTWFGNGPFGPEFDMALDTDYNWWTSGGVVPNGYIDADTVMLHEYGHALGLGHTSVVGSVMEPYYGGARRTPHADDVVGITTLYPNDCLDVTSCNPLDSECLLMECNIICAAELDLSCDNTGDTTGGDTGEDPPEECNVDPGNSCDPSDVCCGGTKCVGRNGRKRCR